MGGKMIAFLKEYILNILTISIILVLLEILIPSNKTKKIVRLISGFILIIAIIKPAIGFFKSNFDFKGSEAFGKEFLSQREVMYVNKDLSKTQNSRILEVYKNRIKQSTLTLIKEVDSTLEASCEIVLSQDSKDKNIGLIKKINIYLIRSMNGNAAKKGGIKKVEIETIKKINRTEVVIDLDSNAIPKNMEEMTGGGNVVDISKIKTGKLETDLEKELRGKIKGKINTVMEVPEENIDIKFYVN
jgi:stage III sporulation protein AF